LPIHFTYLKEKKRLLLAADVGEGLFFAGANHVSLKVMASEAEHKLLRQIPKSCCAYGKKVLSSPRIKTDLYIVNLIPETQMSITTLDKPPLTPSQQAQPNQQSANSSVPTPPVPVQAPAAPKPEVQPQPTPTSAPESKEIEDKVPSADDILSSVSETMKQPATPTGSEESVIKSSILPTNSPSEKKDDGEKDQAKPTLNTLNLSSKNGSQGTSGEGIVTLGGRFSQPQN
jgi:hypothetical protein